MSSPDLAVVIVNWNVRELLIACLGSLAEAVGAAGLGSEIWVVDNASHDGSVEVLSRSFPGVRLIASPINLGFAGGNNLALRAMGFTHVPIPEGSESHLSKWANGQMGKWQIANEPALTIQPPNQPTTQPVTRDPQLPRYVLLLNPDTLVRRDAVGKLIGFMEQSPLVGVCGPRLVYGDGRFQHSAYRFPSLAQTFLDFWPLNWRLADSRLNGRYPQRLYEGRRPFEIDHPLGAAMLFRREAIEQTGGFDLDYRMYVEEIDWCMRVKQAGWRISCVPDAEIVHYEGQSTRQVRPQMVVALWRSRYILFDKHYSAGYRWAVRRLIRAGTRTRIRQVRKALARGGTDGAAGRELIEAYRQVMGM